MTLLRVEIGRAFEEKKELRIDQKPNNSSGRQLSSCFNSSPSLTMALSLFLSKVDSLFKAT